MAKAVRSNLSNSVALVVVLVLGACAHSARNLPPDLSRLDPPQRLLAADRDSVEYRLACDALLQERGVVTAKINAIEKNLQQVRSDNETKSVAGLILSPIWLGMDDAREVKKSLVEMESKKERIERVAQARGCK